MDAADIFSGLSGIVREDSTDVGTPRTTPLKSSKDRLSERLIV
jgi:hypothetical protein